MLHGTPRYVVKAWVPADILMLSGQDSVEPELISASAEEGHFLPFQDRELVDHLSLNSITCIHFLDRVTGKWITHLRNSPAIIVTKECVLHLKSRDSPNTIPTPDMMPNEQALSSAVSDSRTSPSKRKALMAQDVIDLTEPDDRTEKRYKKEVVEASSPLRSFTALESGKYNIGDVPAKLNKFPAMTVGEMSTRFQWIEDNKGAGAIDVRFKSVFTCKFGRG